MRPAALHSARTLPWPDIAAGVRSARRRPDDIRDPEWAMGGGLRARIVGTNQEHPVNARILAVAKAAIEAEPFLEPGVVAAFGEEFVGGAMDEAASRLVQSIRANGTEAVEAALRRTGATLGIDADQAQRLMEVVACTDDPWICLVFCGDEGIPATMMVVERTSG